MFNLTKPRFLPGQIVYWPTSTRIHTVVVERAASADDEQCVYRLNGLIGDRRETELCETWEAALETHQTLFLADKRKKTPQFSAATYLSQPNHQ